jgi:hypothetical protein
VQQLKTTEMKSEQSNYNYKPRKDSAYSYSYYADKYASLSYAIYGVSYDFLTAEQKATL